MSISFFADRLKKTGFFLNIYNSRTLSQFIKYSLTGAFAAFVEYAAFFMLHRYVRLWYIWSNSSAMCAGFLVSFILNRHWSFKSRTNIYRQFALYALLFLINLAISNVLIYLLFEVLRIDPAISKVMVMGLVALWNFLIYKLIIYRN